MVFFKAQKMQRLAELLQRIQNAVQGEGGDLQKAEDEMREVARTAGDRLEKARHLYRTLPAALDLPPEAVEPDERLRRIAEIESDSPP